MPDVPYWCDSITWGKLTDVMRIWPGDPYPLGAAYDGAGTKNTGYAKAITGFALEDEETAEVAGHKPMVEARSIQVPRRV